MMTRTCLVLVIVGLFFGAMPLPCAASGDGERVAVGVVATAVLYGLVRLAQSRAVFQADREVGIRIRNMDPVRP